VRARLFPLNPDVHRGCSAASHARWREPAGLTFALFVATCVAPAPAHARQTAAPTTEDCQACHEDPALVRSSGTSVAVAAGTFAESVHGGLACIDCHQDLATRAEWPHPEKLARASCTGCHAESVAAYDGSVHATARREGGSRTATCVACHGMHDIKPSADAGSRTHHVSLPRTCGQCHGTIAEFQDSIHGRALVRSGLTVAPDCGDCHSSHDIQPRRSTESRVHRVAVPATCGKCHQGIERQYRAGTHGMRLGEGSPAVPTCADCHSAHSIRRTDAPTFQLDVVQECGTCHIDKIETYRDTFHGQVTALGFARTAKCADCHSAHQTLPKSNPASMIADVNLVTTCSKCHAGANASFVKYDPHPNPRDYDRSKVLWWVRRFYIVLIPACFGFFGLHSLLWFWRSKRDGMRE
jgi:hypothetical protein